MRELLIYVDKLDVLITWRETVWLASVFLSLAGFIKDNNSKSRRVFASREERKHGAEHSDNLLAQPTLLSQRPT